MTLSPFLTIVTVNFNCIEDLLKTICSVDEQEYSNYLHIIVASSPLPDYYARIVKLYESNKRYFLLNQDTGIYNAMNIGIYHAKGRYILFLNSGDSFISALSLDKFTTDCNNYSDSYSPCFVYSSIQYNSSDYFFRPPCQFRRGLHFYPHQSFFCPLNDNTSFFNELRPIDADQIWMRESVARSGVIFTRAPISLFQLGGLSNLPSPKTLRKYIYRGMLFSALSELVKYIAFFFLQRRLYYIVFQYFAGFNRVDEGVFR